MSAAYEILRQSLETVDFCVQGYLNDLSDEQLLLRPAPGCNHIAWQLGHLICSEHDMVEAVCPGTMPPLPDGLADRYTKQTADNDQPGDFVPKNQLLQVMHQQRQGTLKAFAELSDEQLLTDSPGEVAQYAPTVGSVLAIVATHWMMHTGQWVVVRRQLGLPPLF